MGQQPLASKIRPSKLVEIIGQTHLLQAGMPLYEVLSAHTLHSIILWGPPGVGKTTIALAIAAAHAANIFTISAVNTGVSDIRKIVAAAKMYPVNIVFIDEIHRFHKGQQDALLPHVENGLFTLIGATTENPSFALNNALLSRMQVYVLQSLSDGELDKVLNNAVIAASLQHIAISDTARKMLIAHADGDARRLLNTLEISLNARRGDMHSITDADMQHAIGDAMRRFDNHGEDFYNAISALHKSVRGSNPDAALYWLCRMIDGGCDPLYIIRRVLRIASEDIGNADPKALGLCINAAATYQRLGSPEGELAIAHAVIYIACVPKSNAVYTAFNAAMKLVRSSPSYPVPLHLRNAPTKLMESLDYGKNYRYAHDEPDAVAHGENYFPDGVDPIELYQPTEHGLEANIKKRLDWLREQSAKLQ